jgi:dipeptidyl-peptidase-4
MRSFIAVVACSALVLPVFAAKKPVTLDVMLAGGARPPVSVIWAPDGTRFAAVTRNTLSLYDAKSGKEKEIVSIDRLDSAATKTTSSGTFDWTNRRVGESPIQWLKDNRHLLVLAAGDLFLVDSEKGSFEQLTQTADAEKDPKLSPDSKSVSFRRGYDLYVMELANKVVTRLTNGGNPLLMNGELDWVYPEELYLETAHWWSPDSQSIAYLQFDTSKEPVFPQVYLLGAEGVLEPERYPKAGDPNADVRLGVVSAKGGSTRWMDLGDPRDQLIARVAWAPDSKNVMVERLNRIQNRMDLVLTESASGKSRVVLHEEDPKWINVHDAPRFLGSGDRFLFESERSGFNHLYLFGLDGKVLQQVTSGDWLVDDVAGVSEAQNRVYFTSTEGNVTERQVWSVALDGTGKKQLTKQPGTHTASLSPTGAYFLDNFSSLTEPRRSTLMTGDGAEVRAYLKPDSAIADEYEILPTEIVNFTGPDGTKLYARLIRPAGFREGVKYPALVDVYGGPHEQTVLNSWGGANLDQVMAHKGFVIWQVDNRGSAGRGHAFESYLYRDMGRHEFEDQQAGIQHLISMGFVDPARIGMYGWSYGGYMTLYTATHGPGLLKAAVSGAPVSNWRNYDSIYTERYMGLPAENPDAYSTTSPINAADRMSGTKLLIVHNMEDDNVHFQNTVQMADAFENADRQFSMLVYSQRSHGVSGTPRKHLYESITGFFEENLK